MIGGFLWVLCFAVAFGHCMAPKKARLPVTILHATLFVFSLICWISLNGKSLYGSTVNPKFTGGHGALIMSNILYAVATGLAAMVSDNVEEPGRRSEQV